MKGITFFEEDREPTPDKPNKIITGIVDDNAEMYIKRLEQENKQLKEEIEEYKRIEQEDLKAFNNYDSILTELEEYLTKIAKNGANIEKLTCSNILVYLKELKEEYKC